MGDDQQFTLNLEFGDNLDAEARNAAYAALARDLREADAVVAPISGTAPSGSKGGGAALAETLSVTVLSSGISAFVSALGAWAQQRKGKCTVRMRGKDGEEYEFNGLDEHEIVDLRRRFSMPTE